MEPEDKPKIGSLQCKHAAHRVGRESFEWRDEPIRSCGAHSRSGRFSNLRAA